MNKKYNASLKILKGSHYKLNDLVALFRNKTVKFTLDNLPYINSPFTMPLRKLVASCAANAMVTDLTLSYDNLIINEFLVGKAMTLKRHHARGRGRSSKVEKFYSRISIAISKNI